MKKEVVTTGMTFSDDGRIGVTTVTVVSEDDGTLIAASKPHRSWLNPGDTPDPENTVLVKVSGAVHDKITVKAFQDKRKAEEEAANK